MPKRGINEELLIDELDSLPESGYEEVFEETGGEVEDIDSERGRAGEAVFKVLQEEDSLRRKEEARKKGAKLKLKKDAAKLNVFRGLKASDRAEKIKQVCGIKADSNNLLRIYSHAQKLQGFILQAVEDYEDGWQNMDRDQKISFLRKHYAANPEWLAYLAEMVKICFPAIDIYRTKCNPVEFNKIILEEVLVPLANLRASTQMATWYSNHGGAVEEKVIARMTELLKSRLK